MLPRDHCGLLLCLFTFDHVALNRFTLTLVLDKICKALEQGGALITMYFDSKKLVQIMESKAAKKLGFTEFEQVLPKFKSKTSDCSRMENSEKLLRPDDFSENTSTPSTASGT